MACSCACAACDTALRRNKPDAEHGAMGDSVLLGWGKGGEGVGGWMKGGTLQTGIRGLWVLYRPPRLTSGAAGCYTDPLGCDQGVLGVVQIPPGWDQGALCTVHRLPQGKIGGARCYTDPPGWDHRVLGAVQIPQAGIRGH